jgi:hypothetical protein
VIALEPEAAALFVKHVPVERRIDGKAGDGFQTFCPGSKYIVVDAGGMYCIKIGLVKRIPFPKGKYNRNMIL